MIKKERLTHWPYNMYVYHIIPTRTWLKTLDLPSPPFQFSTHMEFSIWFHVTLRCYLLYLMCPYLSCAANQQLCKQSFRNCQQTFLLIITRSRCFYFPASSLHPSALYSISPFWSLPPSKNWIIIHDDCPVHTRTHTHARPRVDPLSLSLWHSLSGFYFRPTSDRHRI